MTRNPPPFPLSIEALEDIGPPDEDAFIPLPPPLHPMPDPLAHPALPSPPPTPGALSLAPAHPPSPEELLQGSITAAVADTLHKIDVRAHLELLARTEPKVFRQWVEMALPGRSGGKGNQQATIVNVHSALPKSPLDALPPGFDIHR